jgi:hypothetical protein
MTYIRGGVEVEPKWQDKPKDPFREIVRVLADGAEPPAFVQGYNGKNLTDAQYFELLEWFLANMELEWPTATGLLEAAESIVREAVENGNIPEEGSKWLTDGVQYRKEPKGALGRIKRALDLAHKLYKAMAALNLQVLYFMAEGMPKLIQDDEAAYRIDRVAVGCLRLMEFLKSRREPKSQRRKKI